ncbi:creatininase family protein [Halopelagius fulvigenes]|uniref:Creatininase family protein n=1 Tax=Halopelagius fulvigenes TaxID=1198324 RepID=A0ABD5TXF6_9EURY
MVVQTGLDSDVSLAANPFPKIAEIASQEGSIVVIPVGSVEQHGNHLPVATDSILASAVATASAEDVADEIPLLVAPPVWTGYSPHHLPFGGTMTGEFNTLTDLLEQISDAVLENGFDALLFVNGHGGNTALIDAAVSTIGHAHPNAEILGITYFDLARSFIDDIRESKTGGMAHGGEFETSLMLHLRPGLVGDDRSAEYWDEQYDLGGQDLLEGGPLSVYRSFNEYSESGAIGDPSLASAEKGKAIFDGVRSELTTLFSDIHRANSAD